MKEIKFRAWDRENKMFREQTDFCITGFGDVYAIYPGMPQHMESCCWEITQFTGLKDKNGKEIYEGDIIIYETDTMKTRPRVVKWVVGRQVTGFNITNLSRTRNTKREGRYETIGNIYENPELLDEEKV